MHFIKECFKQEIEEGSLSASGIFPSQAQLAVRMTVDFPASPLSMREKAEMNETCRHYTGIFIGRLAGFILSILHTFCTFTSCTVGFAGTA